MKIIINKKEIKANNEYMNIIVDNYGNGSVAFLADVPKGAIVTGVFVKGKSLEDYRLDEEYGYMMRSIYPRTESYDGHRVVGIIACDNCGGAVYTAAALLDIESFVVEYIETAVAEA